MDTEPVRILPRGRHAAPRAIVVESQRERMIAAMAQASAEKGYAKVAVADVIALAGVSRRTFYEHFANKEDCFLAAYEAVVDGMLLAIEEAEDAARHDPQARALAGLDAYLSILADNPAFARTFLIEVLGAGPTALARRERVHQRFADHILENQRLIGDPDAPVRELDPQLCRALVGAVHELVISTLLADGPEALPALLPTVVELFVAMMTPPEPS